MSHDDHMFSFDAEVELSKSTPIASTPTTPTTPTTTPTITALDDNEKKRVVNSLDTLSKRQILADGLESEFIEKVPGR